MQLPPRLFLSSPHPATGAAEHQSLVRSACYKSDHKQALVNYSRYITTLATYILTNIKFWPGKQDQLYHHNHDDDPSLCIMRDKVTSLQSLDD